MHQSSENCFKMFHQEVQYENHACEDKLANKQVHQEVLTNFLKLFEDFRIHDLEKRHLKG